MPWKVSAPDDQPIIEAVFAGRVSAEEIGAAMLQALAHAARLKRNRFLADTSAVIGGHNETDLYLLARQFRARSARGPILEAVILPVEPSMHALASFWETTASNCGITVRSFADRAAALSWLLPTDTSEL